MPEGPRAKGNYQLAGVEHGDFVFLWDDGQRQEHLKRDATGTWMAVASSPGPVLKTPTRGGIDWVRTDGGRLNLPRLEGALPKALGAVPVLFAAYDPTPYALRTLLQGPDLIALVCDQGKHLTGSLPRR